MLCGLKRTMPCIATIFGTFFLFFFFFFFLGGGGGGGGGQGSLLAFITIDMLEVVSQVQEQHSTEATVSRILTPYMTISAVSHPWLCVANISIGAVLSISTIIFGLNITLQPKIKKLPSIYPKKASRHRINNNVFTLNLSEIYLELTLPKTSNTNKQSSNKCLDVKSTFSLVTARHGNSDSQF